MTRSFSRKGRLFTFSLLLGAAQLGSTPTAQAGHHDAEPSYQSVVPTQRRFAYRPAFNGAGSKSFYLNGYAGASYPSALRPETVAPASEQTNYVRPNRSFFGWFRGSR
ncbi:hypothetical protein [Singulisphaera sp. PoT]|uniref:hypothetical protein n=1 Tax=Singulisphaera sp. PoT TaxID=3411797 RepID=UPI003BF4A5A9